MLLVFKIANYSIFEGNDRAVSLTASSENSVFSETSSYTFQNCENQKNI